MELKSLLAFLFTVLAIIMLLFGVFWLSRCYFIKFFYRSFRKDYCDHFSVVLQPESSNVQLNVDEGKLVKVKITNLGFEDEFKVRVCGAEWVIVKPERVSLGSGESEDLFVYMAPYSGVSGKFVLKVSASSYCGSEEESIVANV